MSGATFQPGDRVTPLFVRSTQVAALDLTREAIGKPAHITTSRGLGIPSTDSLVLVAGVVRELFLSEQAVGIRFDGVQPAPGPLPDLLPGYFLIAPTDLVELDLSADTEETS